MVDWAYVNGMGEDGGDPDLEHHDPAGHCGAQVFGGGHGAPGEAARGVYGPPLRCRNCGTGGLYWQRTAQGHRMHSKADLTPHVCAPRADDFEDLTA